MRFSGTIVSDMAELGLDIAESGDSPRSALASICGATCETNLAGRFMCGTKFSLGLSTSGLSQGGHPNGPPAAGERKASIWLCVASRGRARSHRAAAQTGRQPLQDLTGRPPKRAASHCKISQGGHPTGPRADSHCGNKGKYLALCGTVRCRVDELQHCILQ